MVAGHSLLCNHSSITMRFTVYISAANNYVPETWNITTVCLFYPCVCLGVG